MYDYRLSDAAYECWVLIMQTRGVMYKAAERELAEVGLTPEKLDALWVCMYHPGPLAPVEMARALFRERQTITGLLTRMEKEDLVRRVRKRDGRFNTEVQTTVKGEESFRVGQEVGLALFRRIMSALSEEELEQFKKLIRKLRESALDELGLELKSPPGYAPGEVIPI